MENAASPATDAVKLSITAGEIMLSSGAETYRVEDTMRRILKGCGYDAVESYVTSTGVFASVIDGTNGPVTMLKRVKKRSNHFEKIALVNDLSRNFTAGKFTVWEAHTKLLEINAALPYPSWYAVLWGGAACFCFAYIFGGKVSDCINALLTGLVVQLLVNLLQRKQVSVVLTNILGGMTISILALTFQRLGLGANTDKIIIGSLMPLVPGLSITNAIRDVLEGDYLSGTARIVDAVIIAVCIATGVGTAMKIWLYFFGGISI